MKLLSIVDCCGPLSDLDYVKHPYFSQFNCFETPVKSVVRKQAHLIKFKEKGHFHVLYKPYCSLELTADSGVSVPPPFSHLQHHSQIGGNSFLQHSWPQPDGGGVSRTDTPEFEAISGDRKKTLKRANKREHAVLSYI